MKTGRRVKLSQKVCNKNCTLFVHGNICTHTVYTYLLLIRNHNRNLQTSKAPLKSQVQGTSLFTSDASNQRGFPMNSLWEAQVRLPEGERMRQIRGLIGSTTIHLRTFRLRHFIYRHFVYYCIPAYRTVIHQTSVSANHYFHQFQILLTLWF